MSVPDIFLFIFILLRSKSWAGEMARWFRAQTALLEELGLIPSTYMVAYSCL